MTTLSGWSASPSTDLDLTTKRRLTGLNKYMCVDQNIVGDQGQFRGCWLPSDSKRAIVLNKCIPVLLDNDEPNLQLPWQTAYTVFQKKKVLNTCWNVLARQNGGRNSDIFMCALSSIL